jgi:hypothetical protein
VQKNTTNAKQIEINKQINEQAFEALVQAPLLFLAKYKKTGVIKKLSPNKYSRIVENKFFL